MGPEQMALIEALRIAGSAPILIGIAVGIVPFIIGIVNWIIRR